MITGLHSRKKNSNQEDGFDPETPKSRMSGSEDDGEDKTHRRVNFLRRFVQSEVGCAIEVIIGFLFFGLLFGFVISHHQHRKVRFFCRAGCSKAVDSRIFVLNLFE